MSAVAVAEAANTKPFIRVERVAKRYQTRSGPAVDAIEEVSFDIAEGTFTSIVGPSGCGKSTLMKIIGGLLPATAGRGHHEGLAQGQTRHALGMVFQEAVLLPWRTVLDNVLLPVEVRKADRAAGSARARELLSLVGLAGFEQRLPSELSGGMQQRASIARALINEPDLLLMDEPFGALDALTRESMANELQRIWAQRRKTVLFITHSIPEAVFLSDRVIVMSGRPSRIQEIVNIDLPRPRTIELTGTPNFSHLVTRIRKNLSITGEL